MSERYTGQEQRSDQSVTPHESSQHHERLKAHHEKAAEQAGRAPQQEQLARHEVHEKAMPTSEYQKPHPEKRQQRAPVTQADKKHSFNTTMHHVHKSMSGPEKTFSAFIHKPSVEKVSDVASKTIARPSGLIGATAAAFIGLFTIYGIARLGGFELSGSEVPLLLAMGFATGLFVEWVYKSIRSIVQKKN